MGDFQVDYYSNLYKITSKERNCTFITVEQRNERERKNECILILSRL